MKRYIIYAPQYTHISSGVKALHLLNQKLIDAGYQSKLFIMGQGTTYDPESDIIIYPEIVRGNPLSAKKVVRWLLAPVGLYGGDTKYPEDNLIYAYRTGIAKQQNIDRILCLPAYDESIYFDRGLERSGTCYYAHKYDKIHRNQLLPITDNSKRLEGTPEQIADILCTSEKCYIYEPTEAIILAALCGCPTETIVTPYYSGMNLEPDFFSDGKMLSREIIWGNFERQLERFIEETQAWKI